MKFSQLPEVQTTEGYELDIIANKKEIAHEGVETSRVSPSFIAAAMGAVCLVSGGLTCYAEDGTCDDRSFEEAFDTTLGSVLASACHTAGSEAVYGIVENAISDMTEDSASIIFQAVESGIQKSISSEGDTYALIDEKIDAACEQDGAVYEFISYLCENSGTLISSAVGDFLPSAIANLTELESLPDDSCVFYFPFYNGENVQLIADTRLKEWLSQR